MVWLKLCATSQFPCKTASLTPNTHIINLFPVLSIIRNSGNAPIEAGQTKKVEFCRNTAPATTKTHKNAANSGRIGHKTRDRQYSSSEVCRIILVKCTRETAPPIRETPKNTNSGSISHTACNRKYSHQTLSDLTQSKSTTNRRKPRMRQVKRRKLNHFRFDRLKYKGPEAVRHRCRSMCVRQVWANAAGEYRLFEPLLR